MLLGIEREGAQLSESVEDIFDFDELAGMSDEDINELVEGLPPTLIAGLVGQAQQHQEVRLPPLEIDLLPHQQMPPWEDDWEGWALIGGRGVGKTQTTSYLIGWFVRNIEPKARMRIIVPTFGDAVAANVRGPSGIMAMDPEATWHPSEPGGAIVRWPTGAEAALIGTPSFREVDRLRAHGNVHLDVFEEAAANPMLEEAFTQAELGRRLGTKPRWAASTTPRPIQMIRDWIEDPTVIVSRAITTDNPHLPPSFLRALERRYGGTRLHRQEVLGEIVEDVDGALWSWENLDRSRVTQAELPELVRVAVGVDPPATTGTCGIVAVGIDANAELYILTDASTEGTPERWSSVVVNLAARYDAVVVAETNQGGWMVQSTLHNAGADLVQPVRAPSKKGKKVRAEPYSLLWEKDPPEAHLVGSMPKLEDELTGWVPGQRGAKSPDRLDAMVWACAYLRGETATKGSVKLLPPATSSRLVRSGASLAAMRQGGFTPRRGPTVHRDRAGR